MKLLFSKYSYKVSYAALFLFGAYILVSSFRLHVKTINFPYQLEFREGAVLPTTKLYVDNENPYEIKFHPQYTYNYGFLYPLTVSLLAKYSGVTLAAHRWVTYFFIMLSALIVFVTLLKMKVNILFCFTAIVILHQSFLYNGLTSLARPEGLGDFLYLSGIILPWWFKFSRWSCLTSIILGIAGYFTKPYFILAIPIVLIYMFIFISRKRALIYLLISILFTLFAAIFVNYIYPVFFINTLFTHTNASGYDFKHMMRQVLFFLNVYKILFLIILLTIIVLVFNFKESAFSFKLVFEKIRNKLFIKNRKLSGSESVFKMNLDPYFAIAFAFTIIIFAMILGGNLGSERGAYLFHLSAPFLIIFTFQIVNLMDGIFYKFVISAILILMLQIQFKPKNINYDQLLLKYNKTENAIKRNDKILNSAETVSIMLQYGKEIYNSGHTEYFPEKFVKQNNFLEAIPELQKRFDEYKKNIYDNISRKDFELILISKTVTSYDFLIDRDKLIANYKLADTLDGPLSKIEAWIPIK
ncbi:MAG: hypothetical protein HGGPFJEG_03046 [Ignavibacteria bacterium]|nr:hypothetical protein [Ignavibacteria bacterium]